MTTVGKWKTRGDFQGHVTDWLTRTSNRLATLAPEAQAELRPGFNAIAGRAMEVLGDPRGAELARQAPRSDLYRSVVTATRAAFAGEDFAAGEGRADRLRVRLREAARDSGLNVDVVEDRLTRGAVSALEKRDWARADVEAVVASKGLNLDSESDRATAAGLVDRFYDRAAMLIAQARGLRHAHATEGLRRTLRNMVAVEAAHGSVSFGSEQDAEHLTLDLHARYGTGVVRELAAGRTDALELDFPDPAERSAVARAVMLAATERESFGIALKAASAAALDYGERARRETDRTRDQDRDRDRDCGTDFEL